jgi:head-tail adaptor
MNQNMSLGQMRNRMQLVKQKIVKDNDGFGNIEYEVIANIRAAKTDRRDWRTNEELINQATFSTARTVIQFRSIPGVEVDTGHGLLFKNEYYRIVAVDNDSGRGMYVYVLAEKQVPSMR